MFYFSVSSMSYDLANSTSISIHTVVELSTTFSVDFTLFFYSDRNAFNAVERNSNFLTHVFNVIIQLGIG